jgi:hypothetical protein
VHICNNGEVRGKVNSIAGDGHPIIFISQWENCPTWARIPRPIVLVHALRTRRLGTMRASARASSGGIGHRRGFRRSSHRASGGITYVQLSSIDVHPVVLHLRVPSWNVSASGQEYGCRCLLCRDTCNLHRSRSYGPSTDIHVRSLSHVIKELFLRVVDESLFRYPLSCTCCEKPHPSSATITLIEQTRHASFLSISAVFQHQKLTLFKSMEYGDELLQPISQTGSWNRSGISIDHGSFSPVLSDPRVNKRQLTDQGGMAEEREQP